MSDVGQCRCVAAEKGLEKGKSELQRAEQVSLVVVDRMVASSSCNI